MADVQQPEIQLAQRLASNEKATRSKAIRKLRKYLSVRSQHGGFSQEELLKLWKGLFYCLWMQDKPLFQEKLSAQISSLIHSFADFDKQLLYLESFLVTFKREWTGIDRLRMDKFYQLVRFMFRETFQVLKKRSWENSAIAQFATLLSVQLLHSSSDTPTGLLFHILDLYMTELAAVGTLQLTAEDNLTFIKPFCRAAARTKDRTLLGAICNSIFNTIIDQAPFAIEDLMKELDAISGEASEASVEDREDEHLKRKPHKQKGERINGHKETKEEDDELPNSSEEPPSDDTEPVLQFDYSAVADELLQWASRSNTPSHNRRKLYQLIRVFRDLHEGVFPPLDEEEEVSTDEDDDMFGSRKFVRRPAARVKRNTDGEPAAKKKREEEKLQEEEQNKDVSTADGSVSEKKKKKKKRRKKSKKSDDGEKTQVETVQIQSQTPSERDHDEGRTHSSDGSTNAAQPEAPTGLSEPQSPLGAVGGGKGQVGVAADELHVSPDANVCEKRKRRKRKRPAADEGGAPAHTEGLACPGTRAALGAAEVDLAAAAVHEASTPSTEDPEQPTVPGKTTRKRKRAKKKVREEDADDIEASSKAGVKKAEAQEEEARINGGETPEEPQVTANGEPAATPTKKRKRKKIPVEFEFEADEQERAEEPEKTPTHHKTPKAHTKSKKVTFGLKNNKTAEFKKTDRSLLLSPDGSSRVPFDPKQKPRVGVLKSPPTPLSRKTTPRRAGAAASKATPRKRCVAADFF